VPVSSDRYFPAAPFEWPAHVHVRAASDSRPSTPLSELAVSGN
jgi:hypothetical protein